ncbi:MAG TPA: hypothetical protein VL371_04850 [Gemmataceae bacterium]|jgi:hypothetical protein|nr:hypothetical protein [Gemmataceae bacterium]
MSNARIAERLGALADGVELGVVSVSDFAHELLGHTEALERISYRQIKEAQMVQAQLRQAISRGEEQMVDIHALGDWLRGWVAHVPSDPA